MVALAASLRTLPADLAITSRSRKFYDGTYKWDSDGFTDDHGVHREYNCLDPLARAPTPLPPMFLDDEEEIQINVTEPMQSLESDGTVILTETVPAGSDTPYPSSDKTAIVEAPRTPGSIRRFAIDLLSRPRQSKAAPLSEAAPAPQSVQDAIISAGQFEPGSEPGEIVEVLHRDHELVEEPSQAKKEGSNITMPETPPYGPIKTPSVLQKTSPTSAISALSPVPSNLSEEGKDDRVEVKGASATEHPPSQPSTPSKTSPPEKKGPTTRGVAQKVTKRPKMSPASTARPPQRMDNSVEEFTLLELHSGAFLRRDGLRKSARQARMAGR